MATYKLNIRLLSETTFGRGDGLAGTVNQEVIHDEYGFPFLRGRTLKGALSEECDGIVALLPLNLLNPTNPRWSVALHRLFGKAGSVTNTQAHWQYGDATLPQLLRQAVAAQPNRTRPKPNEVLGSLTTVRHQTAIDAQNGTPDDGSLRAARVLIRELVFASRLTTGAEPGEDELMLLAAGCRALRHIGASRTRGRGHIRCSLHDPDNTDVTGTWLARLQEAAQ